MPFPMVAVGNGRTVTTAVPFKFCKHAGLAVLTEINVRLVLTVSAAVVNVALPDAFNTILCDAPPFSA